MVTLPLWLWSRNEGLGDVGNCLLIDCGEAITAVSSRHPSSANPYLPSRTVLRIARAIKTRPIAVSSPTIALFVAGHSSVAVAQKCRPDVGLRKPASY